MLVFFKNFYRKSIFFRKKIPQRKMYTAEQKTTISINCLTIRKTTKNGLAKKNYITRPNCAFSAF